jgi:hypothetical protein
MLKHTVQFQQEQKKQEKERIKQEEINKICQDIPYVEQMIKDSEKKTKKLKEILSLMHGIKNFFLIEKNPAASKILTEMCGIYNAQKNALAGYENTNQTSLNVNAVNNPIESISPVISDNTPEQTVSENSLLQRIQGFQLKPVKKNEVQMKPTQTPKIEHDVPGFVMTKDALANIKLNSVKPKNSVTSSPEDKPTELELKLAKQQALLDGKDTLNSNNPVTAEEEISKPLSTVPNFENISTNEELINYKLAKLRRLKSSILSDEKLDDLEFEITEDLISRISIIPEVNESRINSMVLINEEESKPNSIMSKLDELLESLKEQVSTLDNTIKKPQVPLSMHFNSSPKDKPVIVGEIPKLKI